MESYQPNSLNSKGNGLLTVLVPVLMYKYGYLYSLIPFVLLLLSAFKERSGILSMSQGRLYWATINTVISSCLAVASLQFYFGVGPYIAIATGVVHGLALLVVWFQILSEVESSA